MLDENLDWEQQWKVYQSLFPPEEDMREASKYNVETLREMAKDLESIKKEELGVEDDDYGLVEYSTCHLHSNLQTAQEELEKAISLMENDRLNPPDEMVHSLEDYPHLMEEEYDEGQSEEEL